MKDWANWLTFFSRLRDSLWLRLWRKEVETKPIVYPKCGSMPFRHKVWSAYALCRWWRTTFFQLSEAAAGFRKLKWLYCWASETSPYLWALLQWASLPFKKSCRKKKWNQIWPDLLWYLWHTKICIHTQRKIINININRNRPEHHSDKKHKRKRQITSKYVSFKGVPFSHL